MVVKLSQPTWCCQFCKTGAHRSCPGAIRTGPLLILCICAAQDAGHPQRPRCLDCGNLDLAELNADKWMCLDQYGCAGRVAKRQQADPVWRMIQACRVSADNRRRQQRGTVRTIRQGLPDDEDEQYDVRPRRVGPKPKSGNCLCCGVPTKGGRFAPGHDARMLSRLRRQIKQGDLAAQQQLVSLGWADHR